VEGSSYLYRAFHALPDLRNSRASRPNAIKGVLSMSPAAKRDHAADYTRLRGSTRREDIPRRSLSSLQGASPPMPRHLRSQIEPLHEAIRAEWLADWSSSTR